MEKEMTYFDDGMDDSFDCLDDDPPARQPVRPLPRRLDLSGAERRVIKEVQLKLIADEMAPFMDIRGVREAYACFLHLGGWPRRGRFDGEAAGSKPFDTHDFSRAHGRASAQEVEA